MGGSRLPARRRQSLTHDRLDCRPRRPRPQPEEHRRRSAARSAGRGHRPVRLGQVVARLRHHLRRGPAPLRRVAVGLRPAVPRADGEAGRRPHRRAVAGHRHRAEDHRQQPALDGRHGHRDLRLPAPAVRHHRRAALPGLRRAHHLAVAGAHPRPGDALPGRRAHQRAGADRPRPQGRVQEGAGGAAPEGLHAGPHRRPAARPGRGHRPRPPPQPHHRGAGRSADREVGPREAPHRLDRRGPRAGRRDRRHQHPRPRRSPVLAADGLHDLRPERARDDAARLLVQLAAGRLRHLPGPRLDLGLRPGARRAGRHEVARRGRHRDLGGGRQGARRRRARPARRGLRHRPDRPVRQAAEEAARPAPARPEAQRRGAGPDQEGRGVQAQERSLRRGLRGPAPEPAPPLRRRLVVGSGGPGAAARPAAVPRLRGRAPASREPRRPRQGPDHRRVRLAAHLGRPARLRELPVHRAREPRRRPAAARDSATACASSTTSASAT